MITKVYMTININGIKIFSGENTDARSFHDVKVFAGDNFYNPTNGTYRNFIWKNYAGEVENLLRGMMSIVLGNCIKT